MNCIDNECVHTKSICGDWVCELDESYPDCITDDDFNCPNFVQAKNCLTCKHSSTTVYETGTIDDIEYKCKLQDKKMIYDDSNVLNQHHSDIPECNCGKWEYDSGR